MPLQRELGWSLLPGWRNGIRDGLKHHCPQGLVGSNPTPGTQDPPTGIRYRVTTSTYTFFPMNVEKAFAQIGDRLAKAREELRILEEQLFFQMDIVQEANTRMVVAETPLAEREHRIAKEDHARLERERNKVLADIEELKREQDRLLDQMASKA